MLCRRRKADQSAMPDTHPPSSTEDEIPPARLTATSDTRLMWPFTLFHASNVLLQSDFYWWNAGTFAPATLRLEIGGTPARLTRIALQTEMEPATARVRHEIRVGLSREAMRTVNWFEEVVASKDWIVLSLFEDDDGHRRRRVRFIEVVTHTSPSYVAWRRIRVWKAV